MQIFFNGGIGDILAIESHMPQGVREALTDIHWASRARPDLQPLFERAYPSVKHHNQWEGKTDDERYVFSENGGGTPPEHRPEDVEDWSIFAQFQKCRMVYKFIGSSFLQCKLGRVPKLPKSFMVVQHDSPYNPSAYRNHRKLTTDDWWHINEYCGKENMKAVVLGSETSDPAPVYKHVIDLQGTTTFAQSVEILKRSCMFWGLDSALSVLAAQLFDGKHIRVRGDQYHLFHWLDVYYAPHKVFDWVYTASPKASIETRKVDRKMKVQMTKHRLIGTNNCCAGSIVEVEEQEGKRLIASGCATNWIEQEEQMKEAFHIIETAEIKRKYSKAITRAKG